jgi:D-alanine transaminase
MVQNMLIQGVSGNPTVYVNGVFGPLSEAKISVLDRGFIFGDGIYEVVPIYKGKTFRMAQHLARLERSLANLRIQNPMTKPQWEALVKELTDRNAEPTSMVYIQVTRGVAKRDHAFPVPPVEPTVFAMVAPMTPPTAAVREKGLTSVSIPDERWLHCDIKSVSLLGNVLAKQAAVDAGVDEVIQFRNGNLTEGASCNIWVIKQGKLIAPLKDNLVLEGIRYGLLEELCKEAGISFELRVVKQEEVQGADEILMSSATREVLAIVQLDGKPVGAGKPGPVFQKLRAAYDARIAAL